MHLHHQIRFAAAAVALATTSACVLAPRGTREERLRAEQAGAPWRTPREARTLPPLPPAPGWRDVLRHALVANGDLEAAYDDWRAALARIDVAAGWPDTNLSLGYSYLFSDDNLKAWDRSTVSVGPDPMKNLSFPTKTIAQGRQAFEEARAAGFRFLAAKLELQRRVLTAWWDYARAAERLRLARADETLADLAAEAAGESVRAGGAQPPLVEATLAQVRARDATAGLDAEVTAARARLNALLARAPETPIEPPATLPPPRPLPVDDDVLVARAVRDNPELAALAHAERAQQHAVGRARQEYIPDFNPFVELTGSMAQVAGIAVSLPARIAVVRGMIAEARAMEDRAAAVHAQTAHDRAGEFLATLAALRFAEARVALYRDRLTPVAETLVESTRASYEGDGAELPALVESERTLLAAQMELVDARADREIRLAELEALGGFDAETLAEERP